MTDSELQLFMVEKLTAALPSDYREKISAARAALRRMIELDPQTMRVAIKMTSIEITIEAERQMKSFFTPPPYMNDLRQKKLRVEFDRGPHRVVFFFVYRGRAMEQAGAEVYSSDDIKQPSPEAVSKFLETNRREFVAMFNHAKELIS